MRDSFSGYNPLINFIYFCGVIIFCVIFNHPAFVVVSFVGSLSYAIWLKGKKAIKFFFAMPFIIMILAMILNPFFVHEGITVLFTVGQRVITKEALFFGMSTGVMLSSVIMWFYCYTQVMTSDKFIYIFGRIIPSASLVFSMVLRFIPRFANQTGKISNGQKCIRQDVSQGSIKDRLKGGVRITSIMTTWALENAIDTADSMRARGYGLKGRTNYSNYQFQLRDGINIAIIVFLIGITIVAISTGAAESYFYPGIIVAPLEGSTLIFLIGYGLLVFFPTILNVLEEIWWKHLQSEI